MKRFRGLLTLVLMIMLAVGMKAQVNAAPKEYTVKPTSKPIDSVYEKSNAYNSCTKQYFMIRSYMEKLEKDGGGTLILEKGTYNIPAAIMVPSNTKIVLKNGVVINKTNKVNTNIIKASTKLFIFVDSKRGAKKNSIKGYKGTVNSSVTASGKATINLASEGEVAFCLEHNNKVSVSGVTINLNGKNQKAINITGCSNVNIDKCSISSKNKQGMGILIDINAKPSQPSMTCSVNDNTVCNNIKITGCTFNKLKNGVYSQRFMKDKYQKNVTVDKCKFTTISDGAIKMQNWEKPVITNNKFTSIGKGAVAVKSNIVPAIIMYGVKSPKVTGNNFDKVEKTVGIGFKKNSDAKLVSQGYPKNSISQAAIDIMVNNNTIGDMGYYYVTVLKKPTQEIPDKFWYPDTVTEYNMTADQWPYRNQFKEQSDLNEKNRHYYTFRSYLEQMERNGGGVLNVKAGTYNLSKVIKIPSNVTINFEDGAKVKANFGKDTAPMFEFVNNKDFADGVKYTGYNGVHDVNINGPESGKAIFDRNYECGVVLSMYHTKDINVRNMTFINMYGSATHFVELDASKDILFENNTFKDFKYKDKKVGKEAINIDIPDPNAGSDDASYSAVDCTPDENIIIRNNTFENLPAAVGGHSYVPGKPHKNIQIIDNTMKDIKFYAVRMQYWDSPVIMGNTISNVTNKYDEYAGEAFLVEGCQSPTITGNIIKNAVIVMKITAKKYSESEIDKSNPNYKKLLKYETAKNNFGVADFNSLGFYKNETSNVTENEIWYRNATEGNYERVSMIPGTIPDAADSGLVVEDVMREVTEAEDTASEDIIAEEVVTEEDVTEIVVVDDADEVLSADEDETDSDGILADEDEVVVIDGEEEEI